MNGWLKRFGRGAHALPALLLFLLFQGQCRVPSPTVYPFQRTLPDVPIAATLYQNTVWVVLRKGQVLQVSPDTFQLLGTLPGPVTRAAFQKDTLYGMTEQGTHRFLWRWSRFRLDTLYRPPDTLGPALEDLQPVSGGVMLQMLGQLFLLNGNRWQTLPFQVDHFRLQVRGHLWVLWGYRGGVLWQSTSTDRGRHWSIPDTLLRGMAFFTFHEGLKTHLLGAFEPAVGSLPMGLVALAPGDSVRLVLEPGRGYPLRFVSWKTDDLYGFATALWTVTGSPGSLLIRWYRLTPTFQILQETTLNRVPIPLDARIHRDTLWLLTGDSLHLALRAFPIPSERP